MEDFDDVDPGDVDPYDLDLGLRPVLSRGAACDPEAALNRCADEACPAGGVRP